MPAPTSPSLAFKLETWAIDILSGHELFPQGVLAGDEDVLAGDDTVLAGAAGLAIVHYEEEERAAPNRIVCRATLGSRDEGGVKPWMVALEIRVLLIDKDQSKIEHYVRAIEETFESPPTVASLSEFSFLEIVDEEEEEKDNLRDSRRRVKVYNFMALDGVPVSPVLAGDDTILAGDDTVLAGAETST